MTDAYPAATTRNSKVIKASQEALYRAFTDPAAVGVWLAPGEMTGEVHSFDHRVGGGYRMSLFYPPSEKAFRGKTSEREDRFTARFVELTPPRRIVQAITFDSADPVFSGEMIMEVTLEPEETGTRVTFLFKNIPPGIRPEDNEAGTRLTLEKLARYVEQGTGTDQAKQLEERLAHDPMLRLRGSGKALWAGEDPDSYAHRLREGWH